MLSLLIKNIHKLILAEEHVDAPFVINKKEQLPYLDHAWLGINDQKIEAYGPMKTCPENALSHNAKVLDASGKCVLPCWCDSHTHLVFAATREKEFVARLQGYSYEEIAALGGGILNSVKKLRAKEEKDLLREASQRLNEIAMTGTGAVEIKSGYGLSVEGELKMLRVIRQLKEQSALEIKATFLGAHAVPEEYKRNKAAYIKLIIDEMLPAIAAEGLADYVDIFCERGYFSAEDTSLLLEAAWKYGMPPKVHLNQFSSSGGMQVAIKHKALSVDHLEVMEREDIQLLKKSNTIATLLPGCSFFLHIPYAPARRLAEAGIPIALASDYNPGSAPSGNMPFILSLACINMGMSPEQAVLSATLNGAFAMGLGKTHGSISAGKQANIIMTKPMHDVSSIPYSFGSNPVDTIILNGKII